MPRILRPPPAGILDHLVDGLRKGRISPASFVELKRWLELEVEVPSGEWYKRFPDFILTGEGELPKTFLTSRMKSYGKEVF
jgi:hypothetical protein